MLAKTEDYWRQYQQKGAPRPGTGPAAEAINRSLAQASKQAGDMLVSSARLTPGGENVSTPEQAYDFLKGHYSSGELGAAVESAQGLSLSDKLNNIAGAASERLRKSGIFSGTRMGAGIPLDSISDLAIWGAAKLARGTVDYGKWSAEMLRDAENPALGGRAGAAAVLKPELERIFAKSQKDYDKFLKRTADRLPTVQKMLQLYKEGKAGEDWYLTMLDEIEQVFGPIDAPIFADFLSATSAGMETKANVTLALKAYLQWKNTGEFTPEGFRGTHRKMLYEAAREEPFGGLKVSSFKKNIFGDPLAVTVDRWIGRAFGFGDKLKDAQYKFIDYLITQVAAKKGVEPRQLQASIWTAMKLAAEREGAKDIRSFDEILKDKLGRDPDFAELIQQARAKPTPPKPEMPSRYRPATPRPSAPVAQ
jgi:hypothetical protein